eukprot:RCo052808
MTMKRLLFYPNALATETNLTHTAGKYRTVPCRMLQGQCGELHFPSLHGLVVVVCRILGSHLRTCCGWHHGSLILSVHLTGLSFSALEEPDITSCFSVSITTNWWQLKTVSKQTPSFTFLLHEFPF